MSQTDLIGAFRKERHTAAPFILPWPLGVVLQIFNSTAIKAGLESALRASLRN